MKSRKCCEHQCVGDLQINALISNTVKSAVTLQSCWHHLVHYYNQTLLAQKRKEDPYRAKQWCLRMDTGENVGKGVGPVFEVSQVSSVERVCKSNC